MSRSVPSRFAFILPGLLWVAVFAILPILYLGYLSFTDYSLLHRGSYQYIGVDNYQRIFEDDLRLADIVPQTLMFALGSTALTLLIGVAAAWVFSYDSTVIRFLSTLFTAPLFVAPAAIAAIARLFLSPRLNPLVDKPILGRVPDVQYALVVIDAWHWTPLVFIVMLYAIRSVPESMYENARLHTTSHTAMFQAITLPRISSVLVPLALLRFIDAFSMFDVPYALTQGGPAYKTATLSFYAYQRTFRDIRIGYGAALAVVLLVPTVIAAVLFVVLRHQPKPVQQATQQQPLMALLESLRSS